MLYQMLSKMTKRDMSIRYCSTNWKTIACMIYVVGGGTFALCSGIYIHMLNFFPVR